jgi:hypothetical protein
MEYRIRFRDPRWARECEAVVEAGSPTEAIVKFRHAHDSQQRDGARGAQVTSVIAANDDLGMTY